MTVPPDDAITREALEQLEEGFQIVGFDWRYLYLNRTATAHARRPREELLGHTMTEAYPEIVRTPVYGAIAECLVDRRPRRLENEFPFADGPRWFELRVFPVPAGVGIFSVDITDSRRALEAARVEATEAHGRLRDLIEHAPDGIFVADLEGRYTDVNGAACAMLGYTHEELLGKTIVDLLRPEDAPRLWEARTALLRGEVQVREWVLRRKDGTQFPAEISAKILADGRWQAFVRDITQRQHLESKLAVVEAKSSGILEVSADAIICIDDRQLITLFNQGAERTFGYAKQEVLGAPLQRLLPVRFREHHGALVARFADGESASRRMTERRLGLVGLRKNGEEFPIDAAISRLRVGGQNVLTVALRDVTEAKRQERHQTVLAEVGARVASSLDYEETLRNIARVAVRELADFCVVGVVGQRGAVRRLECASADPGRDWVCELLRRAPLEDSPVHPVFVAMDSKRSVLLEDVSPEQLASFAQNELHLEALLALEARSILTVPLLARGKALGVLGLVSSTHNFDPADQRLADELALRAALALDNALLYRDARDAVRARDELLSIVAHDLRNPLQSVLLQARLLHDRARDASEWVRKPSEVVEHSVRRMARLIQDLLDVGRMEVGQLPVELAVVPAGPLVADALEAQRTLAAAAGIELAAELGGLPDLRADRDRLLQVFENLLGNALKFSNRGSRVTVCAASLGQEVVFRVADAGRGIRPEELPRLFDRYWQAERGSRKGAGLGLYIARAIIEAHGGRVWVESELGKGTTVSFSVPVAG